MNNGWIKLHRKMLDNPVVFKDADHVAVWVYLLLEATHKDYRTLLGGKPITLKPGQLITGRKKIANILRINEHKVERVLNLLKSEHQIEQQGTSRGSLITIVHWDEYQNFEQQDEQQVSNSRATSEQQVSTKQEYKEHKNNKNIKKDIYTPEYEEIVGYLNEMCGTSYRASSKKTQSLIRARLNEGYRVDDFKAVIYKKGKQWVNDPKMCKFLRPETLFSNKFEGYLNERESSESISRWEVDF